MAEDLLTAVVPVDAAGLLREQWEDAVKNVDLMKIVGYVRSNQTLRSDRKACTAMNAVFQAIGQIQNTGQDLTTGSVKTLQDCKDGLISLIAAGTVPVESWTRYESNAVDLQILDAKRGHADQANMSESFGQVAGAHQGALRFRQTCISPVWSGAGSPSMPAEPKLALLERTKGLPVDASKKLPDAIVTKWQSEKVEIERVVH